MSRLVRHIRAQALPAEAEALRQELLQATPPPLEGFPVVPLAAAASPAAANAPVIPVAAGVTTPAGLTAAGGVANWTIPLQLNLSVSLGAAPPPRRRRPPRPVAGNARRSCWGCSASDRHRRRNRPSQLRPTSVS